MKKYSFLIALFIFLIPQVNFSQVIESDELMAAGTHNALVIMLDISDAKFADKVWKDFVKDYGGKVKKVKGGSETMTAGAEIVGINGVNPINIYAKTSGGSGNQVQFTAWFDLGDEYLASYRKEQYAEAEKLLMKYALEVKIEATDVELAEAEKKFKSLGSDLDRLKRQNDGYHKDIEDYEKKIQLAKDNIVKNEEQQIDAAQKIELQKQLTEEIKQRMRDLRNN